MLVFSIENLRSAKKKTLTVITKTQREKEKEKKDFRRDFQNIQTQLRPSSNLENVFSKFILFFGLSQYFLLLGKRNVKNQKSISGPFCITRALRILRVLSITGGYILSDR